MNDRHRLDAFAHHSAVLARLSRSDVWRVGERSAVFSEITEAGGFTLEVSRVSVWLYDAARQQLELQDLFELETESHTAGATISRALNPRYFEALDADRAVATTDLAQDHSAPPLAPPLEHEKTMSLIDAPIRVGGHTEGILRCEQAKVRRNWKADEVAFVGSLADYSSMALALERRKLLEQQLFQAQKIECIGRLSGGVAHDFNNLLTAITGCAELALEQTASGSQIRSYLEDILEAANRGADLTGQLLAFGRQGSAKPKVVDLNVLIRRTERILNRLLGEDIALTTELQTGLWPVHADPGQFGQILINLAINARDAMPNGGQLLIRSRNCGVGRGVFDRSGCKAKNSDVVEVTLADTGGGIEQHLLPHIFEPFFTTKAPETGTGLGLAMCEGIIAQAEGHIEVESQLGQGTRFHIFLPRHHGPSPAETERRSYAPPSFRGGETVLLVEDDVGVRRISEQGLRAFGYNVIAAGSGAEALRQAQTHGKAISVMVTDVVMPDINGRDIATVLGKHIPDLKVLYISGYSSQMMTSRGLEELGRRLLSKPFTPSMLARRVRKILDEPGAAPEATDSPEG